MARTTRSSGNNIPETIPTPTRAKTVKKRKRDSTVEIEDEPAQKQSRTTSPPTEQQPAKKNAEDIPLQLSGDLPLKLEDANKILNILEMIDTQGLLDRVFPLPQDSSTVRSSFRALLKDSQEHSLHVLRSAVHQLLPISSQPRSRPSTPAAQQLRFCNLALSLLDQASFHPISIPLNLEILFPESENSADSSPPFRKRKYALVQHLPTGDWWTSLSSDATASSTRELTDLPRAHAELVAIIPSPVPEAPENLPTLGSCSSRPILAQVAKPTIAKQRVISCGKFLDYGPFASFAPTFDQEGKELGRYDLGEVVWARQRRIEANRGRRGRIIAEEQTESKPVEAEPESAQILVDVEDALEGIISAEDISSFKLALDNLQLETAVQELLDRNARALQRLEQLQYERLSKEGGGSSVVDEDSEEWDTAHAILESLEVLASMRPRSSKQTTDSAPIIPSASALRKLHRSLPATATAGWYGSLPPMRPTALRDDTTMRIPSKTTAAPIPVVPSMATSSTPITPNAGLPYQGYNYSNPNFQLPFRPAPYPYKPGQTPTYYPNYVPAPTQTGQTAPPGAPVYYGGQPWMGNYSYATPAVTNSGRGTPQPASYGSFFNGQASASNPGTPQPRVVANTIAAKQYQAQPLTQLPTLQLTPQWTAGANNLIRSTQPGTPVNGFGAGVAYGAQPQAAYFSPFPSQSTATPR